jgi:hypothetical protein
VICPFAQDAALRAPLPNFVSIGRQEAHRDATVSVAELVKPEKSE